MEKQVVSLDALAGIDVEGLRRVLTLAEAKGFMVDVVRCDENIDLFTELKTRVDKLLLEDYDLENAGSYRLVAEAFDREKADKRFLLNDGGKLADLILARRSYSSILQRAKTFRDQDFLGGRVFWRHEMAPSLRTETREYNVQLLPVDLRNAVKPTNGLFVHIVYDQLELIANYFMASSSAFYELFEAAKNNPIVAASVVGCLYGASTATIIEELEQSFDKATLGDLAETAILKVSQCKDYVKFVNRKIGITVFGRSFSESSKHSPQYYYTHGSCQDLLDAVAVSIFERFGSKLDIALIDHHSILLDCSNADSLDEIKALCTLGVRGEYFKPSVLVGRDWGEVASSRPSVSLMYGKWKRK